MLLSRVLVRPCQGSSKLDPEWCQAGYARLEAQHYPRVVVVRELDYYPSLWETEKSKRVAYPTDDSMDVGDRQ